MSTFVLFCFVFIFVVICFCQGFPQGFVTASWKSAKFIKRVGLCYNSDLIILLKQTDRKCYSIFDLLIQPVKITIKLYTYSCQQRAEGRASCMLAVLYISFPAR